jgi:penicillin-binding protein 1A
MAFFDLPTGRSAKKSARPRGEPKLTGGGGGNSGGTRGGGGDGGARKRKPKPKRRWFWRLVRRLFLPVAALFAAFIAYISYDLPDVSTLGDVKKKPSIIIKAEDGTVLETYGDTYGDYVPYDQIPKTVVDAVVATEDRNFFHHFGIDPWGLLRALFVDLRSRRLVQGGSTITQQLAKNVFLTPDRKLKRKLQEMVLALELEHRYTKRQILTIYLNRVYMGAGSFGVDAASRRYFGHSVREDSLNESAILVGLLKAPSHYAPTSNPDLSEKRATQVLLNMVDAGYLTQAQADGAKNNMGDDDATYRDSHGFGAFYFTDWIVGQLPEYVGEVNSDIVVTTTLRPEWQNAAEDAVAKVMDAKGKALHASQAALLAMTPDGAIRAMVGGRNYRTSQFNRVTQGLRQPGSSFKLFVYLAALEAGYTPESVMTDQPISVGRWHPHNDTGKYLGAMTLREALAKSVNSIAVQLSEAVGRGKVVQMAQRLGITTEIDANPSIALGTSEVTLFDMTKAYAQLASGGYSVSPYAIKRIDLADGHPAYERRQTGAGGEVLRKPVVEMMNNMLMGVTAPGGTGAAAQIGRPIAGKTGTTQDYKDAWFIGFTPQLITGVWVGNDDTTPMKRVFGGTLPAPIWHEFMSTAMKGEPVASIPNEPGPNASGGIIPWLFGSGGQNNTQAPPGAPQGVHTLQQNPRQMPAQNQPPVPGGGPAPGPHVVAQPQDSTPVPEEEPTPDYNAPPSFWDKLTGNGDDKPADKE